MENCPFTGEKRRENCPISGGKGGGRKERWEEGGGGAVGVSRETMSIQSSKVSVPQSWSKQQPAIHKH